MPQWRVLWLLWNISCALILLFGPSVWQTLLGLYFSLFGGGLLLLQMVCPVELSVSEFAVHSVVLSVLGTTLLGLAIDLGSFNRPTLDSIYLSGMPASASAVAWLTLALASALFGRSPLARFAFHGRWDRTSFDLVQLGLAGIAVLMCIIGAVLMRAHDLNLLLLVGYVAGALMILGVAIRSSASAGTLTLVVFLLSFTLVLTLPLRCCHLFGTDVHTEFWWFQTTFVGSYDTLRTADTPLSVCASISVLPSMLRGVAGLSPEPLMRFLYPCLFSLAPLALFTAWRSIFGASVGFLAAGYFMSQEVFLDATCNPRTVTAVLFLAAFVLALFSDRLRCRSRYFLVFACGIGCLLSHYSTSYVWLAILLASVFWKALLLMRRGSLREGIAAVSHGVVSLPGTALFACGILFLYGYATGPALDAGVRRLRSAITHLHELFALDARGGSFEGLVSVGSSANSVPRNVELTLTWLCFALVGIGVLASLTRHSMAAHENDASSDFRHLDALALAVGAATVLVLSLCAPRIFAGYSMRRTYIVAMLGLSPFLVIGARVIGQRLRLPRYALGGTMVALYLLCTTSVLYQVSGVHKDVALNFEGLEYDLYYVTDSEVAACNWLSDVSGGLPVIGDRMGGPRLLSQGHLELEQVCAPSEAGELSAWHALVYMRRGNLQTGTMSTTSRETLSLHEVSGGGANCIFASGEAEVLFCPACGGAN